LAISVNPPFRIACWGKKLGHTRFFLVVHPAGSRFGVGDMAEWFRFPPFSQSQAHFTWTAFVHWCTLSFNKSLQLGITARSA
jgi:hypothetical protein